MTLIIKGECIDIKDGACAAVCPVDCIYEGARMFYIHPTECVECGLCESICPVDAICYDDEVTAADAAFVKVNSEYFEQPITALGSPGGWTLENTTRVDHPVVAARPTNTYAPNNIKNLGI